MQTLANIPNGSERQHGIVTNPQEVLAHGESEGEYHEKRARLLRMVQRPTGQNAAGLAVPPDRKWVIMTHAVLAHTFRKASSPRDARRG